MISKYRENNLKFKSQTLVAVVYGSPEPPCVKIYFGEQKKIDFFPGALNRQEETNEFWIQFFFFIVRALGQSFKDA